MRHFVFVNNQGKVTSTLASDHPPGGGNNLPPNCIEVDEETRQMVGETPGWTYDNGDWATPSTAPTLSVRDFFMLFTPAEVSAMNVARTGGDAEIDYFWTLLTLGPTVNLGHPLVAAGLAMMVGKGLITQLRANAIAVGTPPEP